jgi:putative transposase
MGLWTKQQLRDFIKENNLVSAQDAQEMLESEMDIHLGYGKHEVKTKLTPNSRNGKSGEQGFLFLRDRLG